MSNKKTQEQKTSTKTQIFGHKTQRYHSFFFSPSLAHQPELGTSAMMPEAEGKNCADVAFLLLASPPDSLASRICYQVSLQIQTTNTNCFPFLYVMGPLEKSFKDLGILYTIFKLVLSTSYKQGHNKELWKCLHNNTQKSYLVSIFK